MYASKEKGVSVIVCCYNSALRIGKTLRGLAAQKLDKADQLEVILVDNGCTDYTSLVAAKEWESCHSIFPLHIHKELKKGLTSARQKGIDAAIYDALLFCDDDNWLSSDYVDNAFACLNKDSKIGACGGLGVAVFENEAPGWFGLYAEAFATGPQHVRSAGGTLISLYGAGLAVKKQALFHLRQ